MSFFKFGSFSPFSIKSCYGNTTKKKKIRNRQNEFARWPSNNPNINKYQIYKQQDVHNPHISLLEKVTKLFTHNREYSVIKQRGATALTRKYNVFEKTRNKKGIQHLQQHSTCMHPRMGCFLSHRGNKKHYYQDYNHLEQMSSKKWFMNKLRQMIIFLGE